MKEPLTTLLQKRRAWIEASVLILIAALGYLLNVSHFTFHRDDWYYIYDGIVLGPRAFLAMFEHLRPLRGPLFAGLFALIGPNPLPYHLLLFIWRVAGGFGMFWLLRLLWPNQRTGAFWAAVLFTVYPGFLWWVGGFEYQPMVLSLGFQVFSIAFMLKAILAEKRAHKIGWTAASILFSWIYLGLVEYAIGMELFRVLCAYILVSRGDSRVTLKRLWHSIRVSIPALLGPLVFLGWRLFFFENWRKAADVGAQVSRLSDAPQTLLVWAYRLVDGAVKVIFMAWTVPLHDRLNFDSLGALAVALTLAAGLAALVFFSDRFFARASESVRVEEETRWRWESLVIGLLGVLGGLVPIVVANRFVSFERFSHYTLPASAAAVVFLLGMWSSLSDRSVRAVVIAALVVSGGLTHYLQSVHVADEARVVSEFWQQVAWRAPDIRPGTALVVDYAGVTYSESSDLVWGPANIIYYPHVSDTIPIHVPISAPRRESGLIKDAAVGGSQTQNYIIINAIRYDYSQLLVISQPTSASCIHVMDRRWPAFHAYEDPTILALAEVSKVDAIQSAESRPVPPANLFGPEPEHGWCYFYEQADLARQMGNWAEVTRLGAEAAQKGFAPSDPIEWIPFLQAHVVAGNSAGLRSVEAELKSSEVYKADKDFYRIQFCGSLRALAAAGYPLSPETGALAEGMFCR
jgi:hypothetical protein